MVTEMRILKASIFLASCFFIRADLLHAECSASRGLQSQVASFSVDHVSIVEAVLTLGQQQQVCFGIEYVDRHSLIDPITVAVKNVTIEAALLEILSHGTGYYFKEADGVILLANTDEPHGDQNLFDHVVPQFVCPRATVQEVSNSLWMRIRLDLDPTIKGFAGKFRTGDREDIIGPIQQRDSTVRQILNVIVEQSKGASWVAVVGSESLATIPGSGLWQILEYDRPISDYASALTAIGNKIPQSRKSDRTH